MSIRRASIHPQKKVIPPPPKKKGTIKL